MCGMNDGSGSAVVDVLEQAKREAWAALWSHITKRGDSETRMKLWREYDLAATTLHGERLRRFQALECSL